MDRLVNLFLIEDEKADIDKFAGRLKQKIAE